VTLDLRKGIFGAAHDVFAGTADSVKIAHRNKVVPVLPYMETSSAISL
jgi:hypothetical protein